jgi:hypothetical protein
MSDFIERQRVDRKMFLRWRDMMLRHQATDIGITILENLFTRRKAQYFHQVNQ